MSAPTREQVVQWADVVDWGLYSPVTYTKLTEFSILARADLESTVKEQAAEIERLSERRCEICGYAEHHREHTGCLRQQLAAAQLHIEQLRGALEYSLPYLEAMIPNPRDGANGDKNCIKRANEALSTHPGLSALEAERQRVAEACARVCVYHSIRFAEAMNGTATYGAVECERAIDAGQWREHLK